MSPRWFIGLSSGSSLSGVDAALLRIDGFGSGLALHLEHFLHAPFGAELRELLWRTMTSAAPDIKYLGTLHRILGETYALATKQLLERRQHPKDVLAVGCTAAPLWHDGDGRYPAILEIGMMSVIAERTGLTTVSDFASRDLALGGQGQPIQAIVDTLLFHRSDEHRVRLHLGGTATVVSLPRQLGPNARNVIGWQAAPCTMLLDGLMRLMTNGREPFDAGGKHAVQGRCLEPLLERWLQNHFFHERPPKCVPRREFGLDFLNRTIEQAKRIGGTLHDVLCTMTHFIARAIVHSLQEYLPTPAARILVSGGGARNGFLWHLLAQRLDPIMIEKTEAAGIEADACRAVASAGLAALTMDGVPINLPSVTGASGARLSGQFTPGAPANWARCLAWMARQSTPAHHAAA